MPLRSRVGRPSRSPLPPCVSRSPWLDTAEIDNQEVQGHFGRHAAAFKGGIGCQQLAIRSLELRGLEFSYLAQGLFCHEGSHAGCRDDLLDAQAVVCQFLDQQERTYL